MLKQKRSTDQIESASSRNSNVTEEVRGTTRKKTDFREELDCRLAEELQIFQEALLLVGEKQMQARHDAEYFPRKQMKYKKMVTSRIAEQNEIRQKLVDSSKRLAESRGGLDLHSAKLSRI